MKYLFDAEVKQSKIYNIALIQSLRELFILDGKKVTCVMIGLTVSLFLILQTDSPLNAVYCRLGTDYS